MGSLAKRDKNLVMANLDAIREALIALMTGDDENARLVHRYCNWSRRRIEKSSTAGLLQAPVP
jgi:hypothetical protein